MSTYYQSGGGYYFKKKLDGTTARISQQKYLKNYLKKQKIMKGGANLSADLIKKQCLEDFTIEQLRGFAKQLNVPTTKQIDVPGGQPGTTMSKQKSKTELCHGIRDKSLPADGLPLINPYSTKCDIAYEAKVTGLFHQVDDPEKLLKIFKTGHILKKNPWKVEIEAKDGVYAHFNTERNWNRPIDITDNIRKFFTLPGRKIMLVLSVSLLNLYDWYAADNMIYMGWVSMYDKTKGNLGDYYRKDQIKKTYNQSELIQQNRSVSYNEIIFSEDIPIEFIEEIWALPSYKDNLKKILIENNFSHFVPKIRVLGPKPGDLTTDQFQYVSQIPEKYFKKYCINNL